MRELIDKLEARFPGLGEFIDRRMAFSIDGEIHQNAWFSPIRPDREVYLIRRSGAGENRSPSGEEFAASYTTQFGRGSPALSRQAFCGRASQA